MKIKTINDILEAVNSDNIDEFLHDFDVSLRALVEKKEALINEKLEWHEMEWIPDGKPIIHIELEPEEPYFGWCDVDGCDNEAVSGGNAWRNTGFWKVCDKHSTEHREGKPQPKMKQKSIEREQSRDSNGYLTQTT